MQKKKDFNGLCPLCYKPVQRAEDSIQLETGHSKEIFHCVCLQQQYTEMQVANSPVPAHPVFVQYEQLIQQYKPLNDSDNQVQREKWMSFRLDEWKAIGDTLGEMREHLQCSVSYVAKKLGISAARLKRFEAGDPVKDAKLLENAYFCWLNSENIYRQYNNLYHHIYGVDYFPGMKKSVLESLIAANEKGA